MDKTRVWKLRNLDCAECGANVENAVSRIPGVDKASVNYLQMKMTVTAKNEPTEAFWKQVEHTASEAEDELELRVMVDSRCPYCNHEHCVCGVIEEKKKNDWPLIRIAIALLVFVIAFVTDMPYLALVSYVICGYEVMLTAVKNLFHGKLFDENFLMAVASIGAIALKDYREAAAVMLFYEIGEYFESKAVESSRRHIADMMDLKSDTALVVEDGKETLMQSEAVRKGQIIKVKNGEKVPLDGVVVSGLSFLDTKSITGEPVPRKVTVGDPVVSGCLNTDGVLLVSVTKEYQDSTVKRIMDLVEDSSGRKAPSEQFITKFSRYYTPIVVFSAIALAVVPTLFVGNFQQWLYRALVFLVISCPCALVISVPLAYFSGIGALAKRGVMVKGGNYLQALADVDAMAFDKTGTLTRGTFMVTGILTYHGFTREEVLKLAASLEEESNHPIARAVRSATGTIVKATEAREISGKGIVGKVDGHSVACGSGKLLETLSIAGEGHEQRAASVVEVAIDGIHAGTLFVSDSLKEAAKPTLLRLKKRGVQDLVMLTGDTKANAEAIAKEIGITTVKAELLPQDKVGAFNELRQGRKVAYVGDGINDAPVLGLSDVGIAMGGMGSDAAIEASDIVVMTDDISRVGDAVDVAKRTSLTVKENITFALVVKAVTLLLGALGLANMWMAIFADVGVAFLAILNSLRILLKK